MHRRNTGEPAGRIRRRRGIRRREFHMGGRELIASHPASATILSGLNSLTGLTVWRHKRRQQRQLECQQLGPCSSLGQQGGWAGW